MLTRNQQYAGRVYAQVVQLRDKDPEWLKKYGSMAHSLAPLVRSAGLCQALQFVHTRNEEPHSALLEHIALALGQPSAHQLLEHVRNAELLEYTKLSRDVLALLVWFKRFAQSVLEVEAGEA